MNNYNDGASPLLNTRDYTRSELDAAEPYFDDAVAISIKERRAYIAGANE